MLAAGSERHVFWLCCVLVGALLLSLSTTPALAQDQPERGARTTEDVPPAVKRLWKEYPLNPTPTGDARSSTQPTRSPALEPGSTFVRDEEGGSLTDPIMLVFAAVAIGLLAVLVSSAPAVASRPRHAHRRSGLHFPRLRASRIAARRRRRLLPGNSRRHGDGREINLSDSLQTRSNPMSKQPEQARPDPGAPGGREGLAHEPVDPDPADYARVGEKVTAVLASAQEAAEHMVASARAEAERIWLDAQEQAAVSAGAAKSEAERLQRESGALRLEAEGYQKETRAAADGYVAEVRAGAEAEVARRLAEADERAQVVVAEAEQRARYVEQEEARRQEELAAGAKGYEERLKSLLEVFRGMTLQLEDLVRTDPEAKDQEADTEEVDAETPVDEGLDDALKPKRHTHAGST